jgi:putative mRNA 3-end processing factor
VQWRDGVQIVGTPLWCDARRAREACFVSSALIAEARRHRQVIATRETVALLGDVPASALAVPYGRPFTLGDVRLELFPSGHMLGSASLLALVGGARVVYAGVVNPAGARPAGTGAAPPPLGQAAEIRACDALVVDAALAQPRFDPPAEVAASLRTWVAAAIADGATPVLLAIPLSGGLELARSLSDLPLRAHRAFVDAARRARALGHDLRIPRRFAGPPPQGEIVVWPASQRDAAALSSIRRARFAAVGPFAPGDLAADAAFPLADRADHAALVSYIRQSQAPLVYLLHAPDALVAALAKHGIHARPLGPPQQLGLFV